MPRAMEVLLDIHGVLQPGRARADARKSEVQRGDDAARHSRTETLASSKVLPVHARPSTMTGLVVPGPEQGTARRRGNGGGILPPGEPLCMVRTLQLPTQFRDEDHHDDGSDGFPVVGKDEQLARGQSTSPGNTASSEGGPGRPEDRALARVYILQVQPTERDIEDRFSVRLTRRRRRCHEKENNDDGPGATSHDNLEEEAGTVAARTPTEGEKNQETGVRLVIGVYDGHRGPWAADYVATTLPQKLDCVCLSRGETGSRRGGPEGMIPGDVTGAAKAVFQELDREILQDFERNHQPPVPDREEKRQLGAKLKSLWRSKRKGDNREGPASRYHAAADRNESGTDARTADNHLSALRTVSGCTASMLILDWEFDDSALPSINSPSIDTDTGYGQYLLATSHAGCTINLGDSRIVLADVSRTASASMEPAAIRQTVDVNSSAPSEREQTLSEHPLDDRRDLIVDGRLFGETLSTRAFGDGLYKLPLRQLGPSTDTKDGQREGGGDIIRVAQQHLTVQEKALHRYHIGRMSAALVEMQVSISRRSPLGGENGVSVGSSGKDTSPVVVGPARTIPLIDRYDAMFSAYSTPPYVSAVPDVQSWHEHVTETTKDPRGADVRLCEKNEPRDDKSQDASDGSDEQKRKDAIFAAKNACANTTGRKIAILATDGLWDLITSEAAVACVQDELAKDVDERETNIAEALYRFVVEERRKRAGDDVTIVVVEYDGAGYLFM